MIVIHYPTAFKALDCFIDRFNEKAEKKSLRLRTGAVMTAKEIVRIYGISLLKAGDVQQITNDNLPTLQTNNHQLAKLVKCSSRTIQRHIARLRSAGIITSKTFHGSNANYELLINPEILLIKEKLSVENTKKQLKHNLEAPRQNTVDKGFSNTSTTNCPHTYSSNTSNIKNNIIIPVDNSSRSSLPLTLLSDAGYRSGNTTGNAGEIVQKKNEKQVFEKKFDEEAGEIVSRAAPSGHRNGEPEAVRGNSLTLFTSLFWMMSRNLLYANVDLTEHQVLIAKQLIYKLYEPVATEHLSKVHSQYIERIALVHKYLQKNPKRFVMLPYLYFNTNNPHGFVGTKKWFYDDQKHKEEVQRELVVSRLIRSYIKNETKEPAKRVPKLQLFRQCENTIGKFNRPELLQRFHAAVLKHETYEHVIYN